MTATLSSGHRATATDPITSVERLLRARRVSCKGRLMDLAFDIVRSAELAAPPVPATNETIDAECYQLALQRLVAACRKTRLPAYAQIPLADAEELLAADVEPEPRPPTRPGEAGHGEVSA